MRDLPSSRFVLKIDRFESGPARKHLTTVRRWRFTRSMYMQYKSPPESLRDSDNECMEPPWDIFAWASWNCDAEAEATAEVEAEADAETPPKGDFPLHFAARWQL